MSLNLSSPLHMSLYNYCVLGLEHVEHAATELVVVIVCRELMTMSIMHCTPTSIS